MITVIKNNKTIL